MRNLIAAAPDMLAELKRLRDVVGEEDVSCIEAVIAKAEGTAMTRDQHVRSTVASSIVRSP